MALFAQLADWWQNVAYLDYRMPSPIYVNPAIMFPGEVFNSNKDFIRRVQFIIGTIYHASCCTVSYLV